MVSEQETSLCERNGQQFLGVKESKTGVCTSYARVDLASAELCWSMHLETTGGELWCLDVYLGLY